MPFFEPNLDQYYKKAMFQTKNIEFTTEVSRCVEQCLVLIIAVNTPPEA
jgi:UDP-glucose 6-dehydrogenase